MDAHIVLLPGDGIGPEVVEQGRRVLASVATRFGHDFRFETQEIGGISIDRSGSALTEETLAACQKADAVLLGAVGGPKWDDPKAKVRPEQGLLALRKGLGVYANLRPVRLLPELADASPLKAERLAKGVDLLIVRELTGGLYFGEPKGREETPEGVRAVDTLVYTEAEIRRVVRLAFQLAKERGQKLTSIDKANVLESSRLWRQTVEDVAKDFPNVPFEHQLVDSAAMRLVTSPCDFGVVVTENMFGDILSDEAAVLVGTLGLLPSASIGEGKGGLYEPIHGSAPDIAGKGLANPLGTILSCAMLLRHSLKLEEEARAVEAAVQKALRAGARTSDMAGIGVKGQSDAQAAPLSTQAMGERIVALLSA